MRTGLILGKFLPFHKGHEALIDFALSEVDKLYIAIVVSPTDTIDLAVRKTWLVNHTQKMLNVIVVTFEHDLPYDGKYRADDKKRWCRALSVRFSDIDAFISSEPYGDILADYMAIEHLVFEPDRLKVPISGTQIRKSPEKYQHFLNSEVQDYFRSTL